LIIARHRRDALIETADSQVVRALVRGRQLNPVTGDEVLWRGQQDGTVVIESIQARRSLLERIDSRGRAEAVAANISALVIVVAPLPAPDWSLADRYLVAAELLGIDGAIVRNKCDIASRDMDGRCPIYARIGYPVIATSARTRAGLDTLQAFLSGHRCVLVGQSGVGKSSLLNALLGDEAQAVGRLSERRDIGRHTTTASMLYRLPGGGELIESPGVRRYSPNIQSPADLTHGFCDLRRHLDQCRFNDCRHRGEPGCAIRAALAQGEIAPERYESFLTLSATLDSLPRN
jgi:ribosome biogenesis GTPase